MPLGSQIYFWINFYMNFLSRVFLQVKHLCRYIHVCDMGQTYSVTAGLFDYNLQVDEGNPCTSHLTSTVVWDWAKGLLGKWMKVLPLPFLVTIFKFRNFALKRC